MIFSLVPTLCFLLSIASGSSESRQEWDSDLAIYLVRESPPKSDPVDAARVDFDTETVQIRTRDDLVTRLRANGIYPDVDAYAAIYILNPELQSLKTDKSLNVVIPRVVGDDGILRAIGQGYLISFTVEATVKKQLREQRVRLQSFDITPAWLDSAEVSWADKSMRSIQTIDKAIEKKGHPLDRGLLSFALAGATELERLVTTDLIPATRRTLQELAEDLATVAGSLAATRATDDPFPRYPQVAVQVTVEDAGGNSIEGLVIRYVSRSLFGVEDQYRSFEQLSPAMGRLDVGNYRIWGSDPGANASVTEVRELNVRSTETEVLQVRLPIGN